MRDGLLIGIDGGGTSTTCWLATGNSKIIGRGVAGPSNMRAIGPDAARDALGLAIARAFGNAGLEPRAVDVACFGLAGFDRLEEKQLLEAWSAESGWANRLVLKNDGDLVIAAGTPEGWGVGLISGTGSIAVGRSEDGRTARAGGWGYLFGDEGSAYWVALAGLRKIARRADGREIPREGYTDHLTLMVCEHLGISGPAELVATIYQPGYDRARIAALAPVVAAAEQFDTLIYEEILSPAGFDLMQIILAVIRKLEIPKGDLPLARAGGFLLNCPRISEVIELHMRNDGYDLIFNDVPDPVAGAIRLARQGLSS